jgi:putative transcriptional regulator
MTRGPHAPDDLLAEYAAGTLTAGMQLLVASHLSYCPCCRGRVAGLEAVGGALLAACEPVAPDSQCLERAFARISRPTHSGTPVAVSEPLPPPLRLRLARPVCDLRWRPLLPGLSECRLDGFAREGVGLMRAQPGTRMRAPGHCGNESRLVLAGHVQHGSHVDLVLPGQDPGRCPEAVGRESCLCLVVEPGLEAARPSRLN